jgi:stage II sporulation protein AA (anti-sigma F factor antagonist)
MNISEDRKPGVLILGL